MRVFSFGASSTHALVFWAVLAGACSDDEEPAPTPPSRLKSLQELTTGERDELWAWIQHRSSLDPDVLSAACTNAALFTTLADPELKCTEMRDICKKFRRGVATGTPCPFAEDAGVPSSCEASLVGEHLDCIEDFRQDTLDTYGGARCGHASSYVPLEDDPARRERLIERSPGCRTLAKSCPAFFVGWGNMLPKPDDMP